MFFFIILCVCIFLLFIKIKVEIKSKDKVYIVFKIGMITIFKNCLSKENGKNKGKVKTIKLLTVPNLNKIVSRSLKLFFKLVKKVKINKADFNIFISNSDYIKGGYYIGAIETFTFMAKNICENLNVHFSYKTQSKSLDISFRVNFEFRLYNIIVVIRIIFLIVKTMKKITAEDSKVNSKKLKSSYNV